MWQPLRKLSGQSGEDFRYKKVTLKVLSVEAIGKMDLEPKRGRPAGVTLIPEHAKVIRRAVKAAARYFGLRTGDFGAWVTTAMRSASQMSLDTAIKLFRQVQQPPAGLVAKKAPRGPSLVEMTPAVLRFRDDPIANPLPQNATADYLDSIFEAAAVLNLYIDPCPGSTMFVMPGTSLSLAQWLVESFAEEIPKRSMSSNARQKLVLFLAHHFKIAERPLFTDRGRDLVPQLMRLGVANRREITRIITEQLPDRVASDIESSIAALTAAEEQRSKPPQKKASTETTQGKPKPSMSRISEGLARTKKR